ncbi:MAG: carboxylating nicotinate-nucleotide diphosphorylase [Sandaracinaceae bacterium]|nr:carboxylating nicotinate-nucleotide diphosphorylase [Sandaracinaceae bacterium]
MTHRTIPPIPLVVIDDVVRRALAEDLSRGDLTTDATVPMDVGGVPVLRAREGIVVAGLDVFEATFKLVDPNIQVERLSADAMRVGPGEIVAKVTGAANPILKGERVALNLIQRMSGVATATRHLVDALPPGSRTRITDTRKTTPGLRAFQRYAVRCGGGHNHREDLGAAVLIKDNHVAACGSIATAIQRARDHAPHTSKIECEVDTMEQLAEALEAGADIVMLDNFDDATLRKAVALVDGRAFVEVSGNVTLERVPIIAEAGVDAISVGGITHSARAVDLGLDWS